MPENKPEIISKTDIENLIIAFYSEVRKDPSLGPIFNWAIADSEWPGHVKNITEFWSGILLHQGNYSGSPFLKHWPLQLERKHFERWLLIWNESLDSLFSGQVALEAKTKASVMAEMFISKIEHHRASGTEPLV